MSTCPSTLSRAVLPNLPRRPPLAARDAFGRFLDGGDEKRAYPFRRRRHLVLERREASRAGRPGERRLQAHRRVGLVEGAGDGEAQHALDVAP